MGALPKNHSVDIQSKSTLLLTRRIQWNLPVGEDGFAHEVDVVFSKRQKQNQTLMYIEPLYSRKLWANQLTYIEAVAPDERPTEVLLDGDRLCGVDC